MLKKIKHLDYLETGRYVAFHFNHQAEGLKMCDLWRIALALETRIQSGACLKIDILCPCVNALPITLMVQV